MADSKFFVNARGNRQLIDKFHHVYVHNKTKPNGRSFWKCEKYKSCFAMAILDSSENFIKIPEHSHGSDIAGLEAKLKGLEAVKKARQNPNKRPRQVLAELSDQTPSIPEQLAQRSEAGLTKAIQRARAKDRDEPPVPRSFSDFFNGPLPEKFRKTSDGSDFLMIKDFVDENSNKAFLIFMSPFGKTLLKTAHLWLADGTFMTAPEPFVQVYMICGLSPSGQILPAAYCLLPNKETKTYKRVWESIKLGISVDNETFPAVLKMDYETAATNGFRTTFPGSRVSGCLFHLKKNLWETVGKKYCLALYNSDQDFQLIVDLMAALSYVKEDQVLDYYDQVIEPLIQKLPNTIPEAALDYVDYFERTYVGHRAGRNGARRGPIFKPDLWSIFPDLMEDMPTTNNALEAFNAQWNASRLLSDNFWSVVTRFRQEDALAHNRYLKELAEVQNPHMSPEEGRSRKIMWRNKMTQLKNLAAQFDLIPATDYLMSVNALIKRS